MPTDKPDEYEATLTDHVRANILHTQATTLAQLIDAGFTPESAKFAVVYNDLRRLIAR